MKPYYEDNDIKVYNSDCRSMEELADESVQCVVTSPPYWGLRKYSGEQELVWGGDNLCEHEWGDNTVAMNFVQGNPEFARPHREKKNFVAQRGFCPKCNAWRGSFGLEPTPELYVQHTIEILREIRRVLRKDGVVFWDIGDSYATHASGGKGYAHNFRKPEVAVAQGIDQRKPTAKSHGLKEKDLCLIPFRVAIAAQENGWWVRSVIIWSKPNPMPESATDRPTRSHEYILMLTKSARYYFDQDAVRETSQANPESVKRAEYGRYELKDGLAKRNNREGKPDYLQKEGNDYGNGRNLRSVWRFPTQPYPQAHFAVFPEKLPEICIKAASKENDLILDPFAGAGTTLWIAKKLGRRAVGYELSKEYCELTVERCRQQALI